MPGPRQRRWMPTATACCVPPSSSVATRPMQSIHAGDVAAGFEVGTPLPRRFIALHVAARDSAGTSAVPQCPQECPRHAHRGRPGYPVAPGGKDTIDPKNITQLMLYVSQKGNDHEFIVTNMTASGAPPTAWVPAPLVPRCTDCV